MNLKLVDDTPTLDEYTLTEKGKFYAIEHNLA